MLDVIPPLPSIVGSSNVLPAGVIPYRLSVEQYESAVQQGILTKDDRCELLEGLLVHRMQQSPPHVYVTGQANDGVRRLMPPGWFTSTHHPVVTGDSVPEPDVSLIRGGIRDYMLWHPRVTDVSLIVEVADVTLERDRGIKRRVYARAGLPIYWIVVLPERSVEVYTGPSGPSAEPRYAEVRRYAHGESVPVVIDGREVGMLAVADLWP